MRAKRTAGRAMLRAGAVASATRCVTAQTGARGIGSVVASAASFMALAFKQEGQRGCAAGARAFFRIGARLAAGVAAVLAAAFTRACRAALVFVPVWLTHAFALKAVAVRAAIHVVAHILLADCHLNRRRIRLG